MRIAIVADVDGKPEGYFLESLSSALSRAQPSNDFLVITASPAAQHSANISVHRIEPLDRSFLKQRWWYDVKLAAILRKWKADIVLHCSSNSSFTSGIPQVLYDPDLLFLYETQSFSAAELFLRKTALPKILKKVHGVVTSSQALKDEILARYQIPVDKVTVVRRASADIFQPLNWETRNLVKEEVASGNEYFLFTGGFGYGQNLLTVLKAFSQFKKWQHSDMKLLIAGDCTVNTLMQQRIATYKFKNDVVVTGSLPPARLARLMAASYGLLYIPAYAAFGLPVVEAMHAGTPVIASDIPAIREAGGDSILYVDPADEGQLAAQMMQLYKDEDSRSKLIDQGRTRAAAFSMSSVIDGIWNAIIAART